MAGAAGLTELANGSIARANDSNTSASCHQQTIAAPAFALFSIVSIKWHWQVLVLHRTPDVSINAVADAHELVGLAGNSWVATNLQKKAYHHACDIQRPELMSSDTAYISMMSGHLWMKGFFASHSLFVC